jgi:hypothetical protein
MVTDALRNFATTQWIPALRRGKYPQTRGTLRDFVGYCCLGVACEVSSIVTWDDGVYLWRGPDPEPLHQHWSEEWRTWRENNLTMDDSQLPDALAQLLDITPDGDIEVLNSDAWSKLVGPDSAHATNLVHLNDGYNDDYKDASNRSVRRVGFDVIANVIEAAIDEKIVRFRPYS